MSKKKPIRKKDDKDDELDLGIVSVLCNFNGSNSPFDFYIGIPESGHHPVHFQNTWLSSAKGGAAPSEWLTSLQELHDISLRNGVNFKELVMYVMSVGDNKKVIE
ncbi:MAG: DUF2610 domain-containing protein [Alphaproteobacteria bacterium]|nr:DUF2610 domain-containing protein [Rickettsiales bacterium]